MIKDNSKMINGSAYQILPEFNIIIDYFFGIISRSDLILHNNDLINDKEFNPDFSIIVDLRDSKLDFSIKEILSYIDFTKATPGMTGKRRTAILTKTPNQVAITSLYTLKMSGLPPVADIFSTPEAAINWLGIPDPDIRLIQETIENIKKSLFSPQSGGTII